MTHDLSPIKERLDKVKIIAPPEQSGIYAAMREDIRTLLAIVEEQEAVIASTFAPQGAA